MNKNEIDRLFEKTVSEKQAKATKKRLIDELKERQGCKRRKNAQMEVNKLCKKASENIKELLKEPTKLREQLIQTIVNSCAHQNIIDLVELYFDNEKREYGCCISLYPGMLTLLCNNEEILSVITKELEIKVSKSRNMRGVFYHYDAPDYCEDRKVRKILRDLCNPQKAVRIIALAIGY